MGLSRRDAILGAAGLALAGSARAQTQETLAGAARARGLIYGASVSDDIFRDDGYRDLYVREAGLVTTDLALKFPILRPTSGAPDYAAADAIVNFAQANNLLARGHTLIWNENMPAWTRALSRLEVERLLDRHIDETMARYAGRIHSWDVVNEPIWPDHGAARGFRRGLWYDVLGPSYVRQAFRRAATVDRQTRLTLNEAFCERNDQLGQTVRRRLLDLVDDLLDHDTPLHAIGLQGHLQPQHASSDEAFVEFLHKLAARKLDIYITELDVDDSSYAEDVPRRDRQVAERYAAFLRSALSVPAVKMVVTWQMSDRFSWYRDPETMRALKTTRPPRPLPFDDRLRKKPAWAAIVDALLARKSV